MSRTLFGLLAIFCLGIAISATAGIFVVALPEPARPAAAATVDRPTPRVEVRETVYDFGVMDPFEEGRHTFLIYNRGDAPLKLAKGETTCRCTLSDLSENVVPPKSLGRVTLEWHTQKIRDRFAHSAEIRTNDPSHPVVSFRVQGKVRHLVGTTPEGLSFGSLSPGESADRSFLVFSQTWDSLHVENVQFTLPGVEWTTREATPDELKQNRATSGLHIYVRLPEAMPSGPFSGSITFDALAEPGATERQRHEVRFAGRVARCVCVYGLEFTLTDELHLGTFVQGERKEWNGVIKLRGERQTLEVQSIETVPSSLQVSVTPFLSQGEPKPGLYKVQIVLPETAEPGTFNHDTGLGKIVVKTDHPLDPVLEIPVKIAVLGAQAE